MENKNNDKDKNIETTINVFKVIRYYAQKISDVVQPFFENIKKIENTILQLTSDVVINIVLLSSDYVLWDELFLNELNKQKIIVFDKNKFDDFVINYYSNNNFINLKNLLLENTYFSSNLILQKRLVHIRKIFNIIEHVDENFILDFLDCSIPTILSQLTGLKEDIDNIIYKEYISGDKLEYFGNFIDLNGDIRGFFIHFKQKIEDKTFLNQEKMKKYKNNFEELDFINRHKILHADKDFLDFEYNKKEYFIKSLLFFNFLSLFYIQLCESDKNLIYPINSLDFTKLKNSRTNYDKELTRFTQYNFTNCTIKEQQQIVAKIEEEQKYIDGCKKLIEIYEGKVKGVIQKVMGE